VKLDVGHGVLSLADTNGLTFDALHRDGTASLWFTGSLANVANALASVNYTPNNGWVGLDPLSVSVNDMGHTGGVGALSASGQLDLTVTNDAPQATISAVGYTIWEDDAGPIDRSACVSVSDANGDPLTAILEAPAGSGWDGLSATPQGGAIVSGLGTTASPLTITGSVAAVQSTLAGIPGVQPGLTGTLTPNFNGTASFNVSVSDPFNTPVNAVVNLPVTLVNDAPVADLVAASGNEDSAIGVTFGMTDQWTNHLVGIT